MKFTFSNYKLFCRAFKLKPFMYKNLIIFKKYCKNNYDIVFTIRKDY